MTGKSAAFGGPLNRCGHAPFGYCAVMRPSSANTVALWIAPSLKSSARSACIINRIADRLFERGGRLVARRGLLGAGDRWNQCQSCDETCFEIADHDRGKERRRGTRGQQSGWDSPDTSYSVLSTQYGAV